MSDDDYVKRIEGERAARVKRLTAPDGWLALVARHWLDEGPNELPIGVVTLKDGVVSLRAAAGVAVTRRGAPLSGLDEWAADDARMPDVLEALGQKWDLVRRGDRLSVRQKDENAPRRANFRGIPCYPIDARWVVEARFESYADRFVDMTSSSGMPLRVRAPGRAIFTLEGAEHTLEPIMDGARLQFIFADRTNRDTTYGAGRFLYAAMTRPDVVHLDFNLAMNPPCAFNDLAVCPLATPQNRLPIRIEAGEQRYHE